MGQRIKITPSNLKTWEGNIQSFLQKSLIKGEIPQKLEGCYICFDNDGIRIRDPNEVVVSSCPKCGGTGAYRNYGVCYDCVGRGYITLRDQMRDSYYHQLRGQAQNVKP